MIIASPCLVKGKEKISQDFLHAQPFALGLVAALACCAELPSFCSKGCARHRFFQNTGTKKGLQSFHSPFPFSNSSISGFLPDALI